MLDQSTIDEAAEHIPQPSTTADVVVGLLTMNNVEVIERMVKSIIEGLQRFFPGSSAMIVNCDGGSHDGTPEVVERLAAGQVAVRIIPHAMRHYAPLETDPSLSGRTDDIHRLCEIAQSHQARACLVIEAGLGSVSPQWIELLCRPIHDDDMDCVVPLFRRHQYEGTLVSNLLYPLSRALYGKRLRYPGGGCYGLSGRLVHRLVKDPFWSRDATRISFDGWMATVALAEGYEVCHAFLGVKEQNSKLGPYDLAQVLVTAVGAVFHSMENYESTWKGVHESTDVPLYGAVEHAPLTGPVNIGRMVSGLRQGVRDLLPLWEVILSPETLGQILPLALQESDEFYFPENLWAQVVYEFALAYHDQVLHREHVLKSLAPLYLGRTASFVVETQHGGMQRSEAAVEALCQQFESMKPYLSDRWRWRDE